MGDRERAGAATARPRRGLRRAAAWLVGAVLLVTACRGTTVGREAGQETSLAAVPDSLWRRLAGERIYFGHQSVGAGIMEGVARLAAAEPRLGVRVSDDLGALAAGGGVFAHGRIGRNGDPGGKSDAFARLLEGPLRGRLDVAFHKYCYADISGSTDVAAVFEHYRSTMERLRAEFPGVVFVHVTTPLQRVQSGPRAWVKKLLGRAPGRYAEDLARERFNDLLRRAYAGREPLFDLAALESTRPDGSRETFVSGGRRGFALVPAYTSDGSHLNAAGQQRVASALLVFLARLAPAR